jgi:diguanylate cyclase (GGDEF)-like protein/PAS domain S-box-containing protein
VGDGEDWLRSLVESSTEVLTILDPDGTLRYASPAFERLFGYEFRETLGTNLLSYVHPEDLPRVLEETQKAQVDGGVSRNTVVYRLRHKDGSWRRVASVGTYLLDGSAASGLIVNVRDVTEREQAHDQLIESERRFRGVVANAQAFVYRCLNEPGYPNEFASDYALELTGYTPDDLLVDGQVRFGDLILEEDRGRVWEEVQEALSERRSFELRYAIRRKDGGIRHVMEHGQGVYGEDGQVVALEGMVYDITELVETEARLRESEERYRNRSRELVLLHQVRTALAEELDLSRVFQKVVEAIADTYGYTQVSAYLLEDEELVLQHEVGYRQVIERIPLTQGVSGRAVRSRKPILLEDVRADPEFLGAIEGITSEICVPLLDGGEAVGFINVESTGGVKLTRDDLDLMVALAEHASVAVSRARLHTQVRKSEERFRTLTQNSSDVVTLLRAVGTIRYLSPSVERILGYPPEELIGQNALDYVHPEDLERVEMALAEGLKDPDRRPLVEYRFRHKGGSWRWLESVGANLLGDPGIGEYVFNSRDVTERKLAVEALKESEQRFRSSFEDAAIGMALLSPDGRYLQVNSSMCELVGYSEGELLRKTFHEITHPEDLEEDLRLGRQLLEDGERTFSMEKRYIRKDGSVVWVNLTVSLLRETSGEPLYSVSQVQDITERKRAEEALRESEERYRTVVEEQTELVCRFLPDTTLTFVNDAYCRYFGEEPEELIGRSFLGHVPEENRALYGEPLSRLTRTDPSRMVEHRVFTPEGGVRWQQWTTRALFDEEGSLVEYQSVGRDITARKEAEEALRESEARLAEAQRIAHVGSWEWDVASDTVTWSDELYRIFGRTPEEFENTYESFLQYVHPEDMEHVRETIRHAYESGKPFAFEHRLVRPDGTVRTLQARGEVITNESGEKVRLAGTAQDVTERKALEERLEHQAFHDLLTGLPNRHLFVDRLGQALRRTRRRNRNVAVLFTDLDGFKVVNDSLGHETGDMLLVAVAQRLESCLRPEDTLARFGGDEFVVLLEDVGHPDEAVRVARRLVDELRSPFFLEGRELFAGVSVGIAVGHASTKDAEDLLRDADTAMYRAKDEGTGYSVFDPVLYEHALDRLELENDLRRAIERDEFVVHYQPIFQLGEDGGVWGLEALVRWDHPERGLLNPDEFVKVAEESGLVVPMGEQVLEEACRHAKEWQDEYPRTPAPVFSVNLSARQLQRPDLAERIGTTLRKTGLEGSCLALDITETVYIGTREGNTATLDRLRKLGVRISIDDFGMGYSSLSYLKRLPADTLKIDKSFIKGLGEDVEDTAIVRMVVDLAHTLGMEVIAEGVEEWAQATLLSEMGCDFGQGLYFSEPLAPEAAARFLAE